MRGGEGAAGIQCVEARDATEYLTMHKRAPPATHTHTHTPKNFSNPNVNSVDVTKACFRSGPKLLSEDISEIQNHSRN